MTTKINTIANPAFAHTLTADEAVLLGQVIDIDGADAVILADEDLRNASGRLIGETLLITDDAWEAVQRSRFEATASERMAEVLAQLEAGHFGCLDSYGRGAQYVPGQLWVMYEPYDSTVVITSAAHLPRGGTVYQTVQPVSDDVAAALDERFGADYAQWSEWRNSIEDGEW